MTTTPTPPAPMKPPFWRRTWFVAVVALVIGFGMGSAGSGGGGSSTAAAPAPTVTVTADAAASQERTPESCLRALDLAGEMMDAVATEHGEISEAATKAGETGSIVQFGADMRKAMEKLTATSNRLQPQVREATADCRAKA